MISPNTFAAETSDGVKRFEYKPKGNTMFLVQGQDKCWVPITVIVFSNSKKNAIEVVKDSIASVKKHSICHRQLNIIENMNDLKFTCEVAMKNRLYNTDWADNAGPF